MALDSTHHLWHPVPRSHDHFFTSAPPSQSDLVPYDTKSIPYPTTPLVKATEAFAKSNLPPATLNHSYRIFFYGLAILRAGRPDLLEKLDEETWAVTCLLHDIGLAEKFHLTTNMSFEFKGGIVARDFLLSNGATESQADSVCESIILHQDVFITTGNIHLGGQLIQLATLFDNAGGKAEWVHVKTIEAVCTAYPRGGWSEKFACAVESEMRAKPWSHTTTFEEPGWRQGEKGSKFGSLARGNKLMEPYD
ncbi:cyanamide hydratase [Naematelia encephala]|uniref:Cyanamide hydratase n=1 Tax=Naematelia encephala TaxID=71784 RepID=A0A1Y2BKW0_9TREE|nr:cyanamide hydratase [Naematelia encephala]